jgi:hypothetical protein
MSPFWLGFPLHRQRLLQRHSEVLIAKFWGGDGLAAVTKPNGGSALIRAIATWLSKLGRAPDDQKL